MIPSNPSVIAGIGDDCAVVRRHPRDASDLVLTSDPVIEGVHFTAGTAPDLVGHKAVARSLSDIAAMGAEPLWALIDVVAPGATPSSWLLDAYASACRTAAKYGLVIVGGDTAEGPSVEFHVFVAGSVPRGRALLRSGARPGDTIYVTGTLGGTLAGKHLSFQPRLKEGVWLRKNGYATSLMDLSDGLASDIRQLTAASGTGATINLEAIPVSKAANQAGPPLSPLQHALCDGEDYELLLTVPVECAGRFESHWRKSFALQVSAVGAITPDCGSVLFLASDGSVADVAVDGYEHFAGCTNRRARSRMRYGLTTPATLHRG